MLDARENASCCRLQLRAGPRRKAQEESSVGPVLIAGANFTRFETARRAIESLNAASVKPSGVV